VKELLVERKVLRETWEKNARQNTEESPGTASNSVKAEITSIFNDAFVNVREGICVISYQQFTRLRQLSAV
jgi:hypothetical protein